MPTIVLRGIFSHMGNVGEDVPHLDIRGFHPTISKPSNIHLTGLSEPSGCNRGVGNEFTFPRSGHESGFWSSALIQFDGGVEADLILLMGIRRNDMSLDIR